MNNTEDELRAAISHLAEDIHPDTIRHFDPTPQRAIWSLSWRPGRRTLQVLGPVMAAAVVALLVVASLTLRTGLSHSAVTASPAQIPPYYIALTATGSPATAHPADITVRSTIRGTVLATVAAPRPYGTFTLVDGTADPTTFMVAARRWAQPSGPIASDPDRFSPLRLFRLHYQPDTAHVTLTPLAVPEFSGSAIEAAALSPDGKMLAVALNDAVRVYNLRTGTVRTWAPTAAEEDGGKLGFPISLSWAADDHSIVMAWDGSQAVVRLLDTNLPGDDLIRSSRVLFPLSSTGKEFECADGPFMAADGAVVLCGGGHYTIGIPLNSHAPGRTGFGEFSTVTGRLIRVLDSQTTAGATSTLFWSSPDASTVIGLLGGHAVVYDNGRQRTIPWSASLIPPEGSLMVAAAW